MPTLEKIALAVCALALLPACGKSPSPQTPRTHHSWPEIWLEFSGERAMQHVRAQVEIGPRPSGSASIERARRQIAAALADANWDVEQQEFESTPIPHRAALRYVNLIARFPSKIGTPSSTATQRAIVASHYDTKRMEGIKFLGANDGASSTGALIELARALAKLPDLASQVELVFFDGEEAVEAFGDPVTGTDGLIGSRHYSIALRKSGRARQFQFAILWDMIGDANPGLTLPSDSPRVLADGMIEASEALGIRSHVDFLSTPILDDHVPLQLIARIPAIDLIDFDYPHWHTAQDTLDKLSPKSIENVGQITLWHLHRALAK